MNKINKNYKTLSLPEKSYLVFVIGAIILLMTVLKGNTNQHNDIIRGFLIALLGFIIYKFLNSIKGKTYFRIVLILNISALIFITIQALNTSGRNSLNGLGVAFFTFLVLFIMFLVDFILWIVNKLKK